jgi:hypothetical protein
LFYLFFLAQGSSLAIPAENIPIPTQFGHLFVGLFGDDFLILMKSRNILRRMNGRRESGSPLIMMESF